MDLSDSFHCERKGEFGDKKISKNINKKRLESLIKSLIEKSMFKKSKNSAASQNRKMSTIKSFIKWLEEENYVKEGLRPLYPSPKVGTKIIYFLSLDEILSILNFFKLCQPETLKQKKKLLRDQALFFLLYGGGLRVNEACQIKWTDVNLESSTLLINGKGGKQRLIPLPQIAYKALKDLFDESHPYVFGLKPLCTRKAYDIIRSLGKKAGLIKHIHPHALRHSFATHILLGGANLRVVQELLGHKALTSTQKYTHLDLNHLSKTLEKCHPLKKKKILKTSKAI